MILVDNRNTTDPYLNLAIEEFLIRNLEVGDEDYLLFYVNEPCIVLGKNQSIYKEVNFEYLRSGRLQLARRITGGGTVYHDEGNLNFSIITKFAESKVNNYKYFNQPVIDALSRARVEAGLDGRNNIICNGKKISGSAQFTNRKNIISHGTLLFNANLDVLRECLKANDFKLETRAVNSVNSSVMNLNEITSRLAGIHSLQEFLTRQLNVSSIHQLAGSDWAAIEKLAGEKFKSFAWVYGRSPFTRIEKSDLVIEIEDGLIVSVAGIGRDFSNLKGVPYEYQSIKKALENYPNANDLIEHIF